jgi:hypothetical protein
MPKNQSNKREIVRLDEVPRSRTPEPAPKRERVTPSRTTAADMALSCAAPVDTALSHAAPADTALSHAAPADTASRMLIAVEPGGNTSSALSCQRCDHKVTAGASSPPEGS